MKGQFQQLGRMYAWKRRLSIRQAIFWKFQMHFNKLKGNVNDSWYLNFCCLFPTFDYDWICTLSLSQCWIFEENMIYTVLIFLCKSLKLIRKNLCGSESPIRMAMWWRWLTIGLRLKKSCPDKHRHREWAAVLEANCMWGCGEIQLCSECKLMFVLCSYPNIHSCYRWRWRCRW